MSAGDGLGPDGGHLDLLPDVGGEGVQVARVGLQGVARERALDAEVVEVRVDPAGQVHRCEGTAPAIDGLSSRVSRRLGPRRARVSDHRGQESAGVVLAHEGLADEGGVGPIPGDERDVGAAAEAGEVDAHDAGRDGGQDARGARGVHCERVEVPRVDADDAGAGFASGIELVLVDDLDERLDALDARRVSQLDEPRSGRRCGR